MRVRRDGTRLAFAAPPLRRSGEVDAATLAQIARCLKIPRDAIRASNWVANGPHWVAVMLGSREELLALQPDFAAMGELELGDLTSIDYVFHVCAWLPLIGLLAAFLPGTPRNLIVDK